MLAEESDAGCCKYPEAPDHCRLAGLKSLPLANDDCYYGGDDEKNNREQPPRSKAGVYNLHSYLDLYSIR
jgi:hypothetical protein